MKLFIEIDVISEGKMFLNVFQIQSIREFYGRTRIAFIGDESCCYDTKESYETVKAKIESALDGVCK